MIVLLIMGIKWQPYLSFADSINSIYISWKTDTFETTSLLFGADTLDFDTINLGISDTLHHVKISGLSPSTFYYYKIGDKIYGFKTPPDTGFSFSFLSYGDSRSRFSLHKKLVENFIKEDFDFVLHTGDLVSSGSNILEWDSLFSIIDTFSSSIPFMPAIGNHESPYTQYISIFALPDTEWFYRFKYLNSLFISLNSEDPNLSDTLSSQYLFLKEVLSSAIQDLSIDWIFVYFHRPPYSASSSHGCDMTIRKVWCPLFANKVDIVFNGHNHIYMRTKKINGVVYITTGGGGAPLHTPADSPWTAVSSKNYHYLVLKIENLKLTCKTIGMDTTSFDTFLIDTFTLIKRKDVKLLNHFLPCTVKLDSSYELKFSFTFRSLFGKNLPFGCEIISKDTSLLTSYSITHQNYDTFLLDFGKWLCPYSRTNYEIKVYSLFQYDTIRGNDTLRVLLYEINDKPVIKSVYPSPVCSLNQKDTIEFLVNAIDPDRDSLSYLWKFKGNEIYGDSSIFIYVDTSMYVSVIVSDGELSDTALWKVYLNLQSLSEENENIFKIYPNPFTNYATLYLNRSGDNFIRIYDCTGRMLKEVKIKEGAIKIGEDLKSGVYFYIIKCGVSKFTGKLIKL